MDAGNITVSATAAVGLVVVAIKTLGPAWVEQQIARSPALADLKHKLAAAEHIHGDFAKLNGTLEAIATNTEATHRATVQLGEKVGALAERVAAVEAVQDVAPPRAKRGRG